mgnify:CR=1 FL=1
MYKDIDVDMSMMIMCNCIVIVEHEEIGPGLPNACISSNGTDESTKSHSSEHLNIQHNISLKYSHIHIFTHSHIHVRV